MINTDHLKNLDVITTMAGGRREIKLQAFAASFTVTTEMGADGQRRLEPTLEIRPDHIGNTAAVLYMLEAALGLAMPPATNWRIKRVLSPEGIHIELAEWGLEEAAHALATLEGVVQGTVGSYFSSTGASSVARKQAQSFSFVSGGVLIAPQEAIRILFRGYTITRRGIVMNEARQLVPMLQLEIRIPKEARARTAVGLLFEAMFKASSVRREGFGIQMEHCAHGLQLSTELYQGTPREALRALQILEECVTGTR